MYQEITKSIEQKFSRYDGKDSTENLPSVSPTLWSKILDVDWKPKKYEIVFLLYALICAILVSQTHLSFSYRLAASFVMRLWQFIGAVYVLSLVVILYRYVLFRLQNGSKISLGLEGWVDLTFPYCTLNFLMLSIRRGLSILGVVFFFLHLKHVILLLHPVNHDLFFWNLDRNLHFGVQPNVWLMERFGTNHNLALFIDWIYFKYFDYLKIAAVVFLLEIKGRELTEKFFLAYTLLWSIGGLSYLLMPTDGPCYAVLGNYSVKEDQRRHMFAFPVSSEVSEAYLSSYSDSKIWHAKGLQQELWENRLRFLSRQGLPNRFYGIAAMPSLHVAAVTMVMIFYFMLSPLLGFVSFIFGVIVFVGSVFLQWHYAIDGYMGILFAVLVSFLSIRLGGSFWRRGQQQNKQEYGEQERNWQ